MLKLDSKLNSSCILQYLNYNDTSAIVHGYHDDVDETIGGNLPSSSKSVNGHLPWQQLTDIWQLLGDTLSVSVVPHWLENANL